MARPIRIIGHGVKPADQFQAHPNNPRKHPQRQRAAVAESLSRLGWYDVVIENVRTGNLIDGHERIWQALEAGDDVPFIQVDLSEEEERLALASHDWLSSLAEYDRGMLDDLLHQIDDGGKLLEEMAADFDLSTPDSDGLVLEDEEPPLDLMPPIDLLFPSSNAYGIPDLDPKMQGRAVVAPVTAWGTIGRAQRMTGTYHFYVDDYRFNQVWARPDQVLNTRPVAVVEPNYSMGMGTPRAYALWCVYRKRWLARYWQMHGVQVFVDLNTAPEFHDIDLLGVPKGWKAYSTRGYTDRLHDTELEYEHAVDHAGGVDELVFLLYGGGKAGKAWAQEHGAYWVEEQQTVKGA